MVGLSEQELVLKFVIFSNQYIHVSKQILELETPL